MKRYDMMVSMSGNGIFHSKEYEAENGEWCKFAEVEKAGEAERERLQNGRDYLMQVNPSELTVEDCLVAFGWNENGFEE